MRVIVTGKQGQVARSLFERASAHGIEVELVGRPDLDLTDARGVSHLIVTDVVNLERAGVAVAKQHVRAVGAVKATEAGDLPLAADLAQRVLLPMS